MSIDLKNYILDVPDFPKPGIVFKDITPVVQSAQAFHFAVDELAAWARPLRPEILAGIESRGFLFAAALARELRLGLTVIRKKGKLPRKAACVVAPNEYALEHFEMHEDGVAPGQRVLIVDDLIATGSLLGERHRSRQAAQRRRRRLRGRDRALLPRRARAHPQGPPGRPGPRPRPVLRPRPGRAGN